MKILALIGAAILLTACNSTGSNTGYSSVCAPNTHAKYAKKGTLAYDQYGCPIGADPSPQVRNSLWRDNSESD
jgi:hypothetical protein